MGKKQIVECEIQAFITGSETVEEFDSSKFLWSTVNFAKLIPPKRARIVWFRGEILSKILCAIIEARSSSITDTTIFVTVAQQIN